MTRERIALPPTLTFKDRPAPPRWCRTEPGGNRDWEAYTDPGRRYVYSLESSFAYLAQWRIGAGGVLHPLTPHRVAARSHPEQLRFHPSGRFAYVSCSHGAVCQYRVRSGALIPLDPAAVHATSDPVGPWFDASGRFACVLSAAVDGGYPPTDRVYIYAVGKDGRLKEARVIEARGASAQATRRALRGDDAGTLTIQGDRLLAR